MPPFSKLVLLKSSSLEYVSQPYDHKTTLLLPHPTACYGWVTIAMLLVAISFEPVLSLHCLAALDLGAGVEEPFICLRSPRTARPCRGRWIGQYRTICSTVLFFLRHTHRPQKGPYHICTGSSGNAWHTLRRVVLAWHTSLLESNSNGKRLWLKSPDTDTNIWAAIQWLDGLVLHLLTQFFKPQHDRTSPYGQVLSSHSIVSSSRTVRPCSPWEGRWIGHWRTTWSTVCLSAPHSQTAEEATPYLYKQERKRPTSVRRWLRRTQALLGMVIPGGCRCRGWKCGVLWSCPPTPHSTGDPPTVLHVCCCC